MGLSENIRARRESKKMTQEELADKAGIARPYLSQIENDIRKPTIQVGYLIAKALDCKIDDLIEKDVRLQ